jgi:hypothetical protein
MVEVPHPYVEATHERDRAEIHAQDGRIIRGAIHGFYPESIAIKDDVSGTVLQLPNDEVMSKQSLVWQKCNVMLDQSFRRWLLLPSFIVPGLGQVLYEDSISVSGGTHAVIHLGLIGGMVNAMNLEPEHKKVIAPIMLGALVSNWLWSLTEAVILASGDGEEPAWNCEMVE